MPKCSTKLYLKNRRSVILVVQILVLGAIICALALMVFNYIELKTYKEGTAEMADIAKQKLP